MESNIFFHLLTTNVSISRCKSASFYSDTTQEKKQQQKSHFNIKIIKTSLSLENLG